jgi:DNA polymerase-3 subunit gamma/tau
MARAVFTPVDVVATAGDTITLAAPNATHLAKCREHLALVEQACADALGRPITIELVVKDAPAQAASAPPAPPDEDIDLDDLVDAPAGSAPTTLDRLAEAFPGSELVERDR